MMFVLGALAVLAHSDAMQDPDAVVTRDRAGMGSVPVASEPIETSTPSMTVTSATQGLTTEQQIERWMQDRPVVAEAPVWRDNVTVSSTERKMTGEVHLGIGTHDYSHASAYVSLPLGENATLSLGYSQTKNGLWERPMGVDGLFWSPRDEYLGPQWMTATGRSYSPIATRPSLLEARALEQRLEDISED